MKAKKNAIYPLIVIKTPSNYSFFNEHNDIIKKNGYVWFAKMGKGSIKATSIKECEPILFIKDSGDLYSGLYVANILEVTDTPPGNAVFPNYYLDINRDTPIWVKIDNLHSLSVDLLESSFESKNGGSVLSILRSICPAFFIKCKHTVSI